MEHLVNNKGVYHYIYSNYTEDKLVFFSLAEITLITSSLFSLMAASFILMYQHMTLKS